jgi:phage terminase small subunit
VPTRLVLILAMLALPMAGCGGAQKDTYRKDFQQSATQFRASLQRAGTKVRRNATLPERAPAIAAARRSVDKLASDLGKLDPPDELKKTHEDAVRQLRTLSSDLGDYGAAARDNDANRAQRIVPKVQADQTVLQKTLDQLDRKAAA